MDARPLTAADIPALVALHVRWETGLFGRQESSEDEIREFLDKIDDFDERTRVIVEDGSMLAAGLCWFTESVLVIDPAAEHGPIHADLLPWFAARPPGTVDALSTETDLRLALEDSGWVHKKSSFDLICQVTPELDLPEPGWPDGVEVRGFRREDAEAAHRLIYVDAAWSEVPGHPHRELDEWATIFVTEHSVTEPQVLAYRGERLVGISMGRTWDDGTGWISQLAVAKDERGNGLGRALLRESLRARRDGGANALGLSVQAQNRAALQMYLDAGLQIEREWMTYASPG